MFSRREIIVFCFLAFPQPMYASPGLIQGLKALIHTGHGQLYVQQVSPALSAIDRLHADYPLSLLVLEHLSINPSFEPKVQEVIESPSSQTEEKIAALLEQFHQTLINHSENLIGLFNGAVYDLCKRYQLGQLTLEELENAVSDLSAFELINHDPYVQQTLIQLKELSMAAQNQRSHSRALEIAINLAQNALFVQKEDKLVSPRFGLRTKLTLPAGHRAKVYRFNSPLQEVEAAIHAAIYQIPDHGVVDIQFDHRHHQVFVEFIDRQHQILAVAKKMAWSITHTHEKNNYTLVRNVGTDLLKTEKAQLEKARTELGLPSGKKYVLNHGHYSPLEYTEGLPDLEYLIVGLDHYITDEVLGFLKQIAAMLPQHVVLFPIFRNPKAATQDTILKINAHLSSLLGLWLQARHHELTPANKEAELRHNIEDAARSRNTPDFASVWYAYLEKKYAREWKDRGVREVVFGPNGGEMTLIFDDPEQLQKAKRLDNIGLKVYDVTLNRNIKLYYKIVDNTWLSVLSGSN